MKTRQRMLYAATILLCAAAASAGVITVGPPSLALSGAPGTTLAVFVDLANTSAVTEFLNGISTSGLAGLGANPFNTNSFFTDPSVPLSLDAAGLPGAAAVGAHLFDITIPLGTATGLYNGGFTLTGGANVDAGEPIATALVTVQVDAGQAVPEPGSVVLVMAGLAVLGWRRLRSFRTSESD